MTDKPEEPAVPRMPANDGTIHEVELTPEQGDGRAARAARSLHLTEVADIGVDEDGRIIERDDARPRRKEGS